MTEPTVDHLLSVDQAIEILDRVVVSPRIEELPLETNLLGCVLAADVRADRDYPPFDRALMDGYAVRSADGVHPRQLLGEVAAGASYAGKIGQNECVAIMTGAPVPDGADAVVAIELTARADDVITINAAVKPGQAISRQGADCASGTLLCAAGSVITPAALGVLATVGASRVRVISKPRVGVMSTGDEIIAIDQSPSGSQIRNSNNILLRSLLQRLGAEALDLGHVCDHPDLIRNAISAAKVDALLVTGGMSMGAYDYVPRVLMEMGYALRITKLKIKPGKPFVLGVAPKDQTPALVFGLPGNPVSGFVCTLRLVDRVIRRLGGRDAEPAWLNVQLQQDLPPNGAREFYVPGRAANGSIAVFDWKGSADLFTLMKANALLLRPANDPARRAGDVVRAMEIPQ